MPSLTQGQANSASNPVLDVYTSVGAPGVLTNVAVLEFRVLDISTPAKRATPVQTYPALAGTWQALDPTLAVTAVPTAGHRLSTGRFYAPWTVPDLEPVGDHRIEWRWKLTLGSPYVEGAPEEFYIAPGPAQGSPGPAVPGYFGGAALYTSIAEIRAEGFTDTTKYPDSRIDILTKLVTRYVDKVTMRWFGPRVFGPQNRMRIDGKDSRAIFLNVPIIQVDRVLIEWTATLTPDLSELELSSLRIYNRHMAGMTAPDDRDFPRIEFAYGNRLEYFVAPTPFWPAPTMFPRGKQNVHLEGVFGYTDPDGSPYGIIPDLIRQAAMRLVVRDLLPEADYCAKYNIKNKYRLSNDREGSTSVSLQDLWLKGCFTGDPEIDQILTMYRRPSGIAVA